MKYSEKLDFILRSEMEELIHKIECGVSPFNEEEIWELYDRYLSLL